ncbi:MAG: penicillin-binding transpeptidase domain-containing protein [Candidatus Rokuibacteriota bacterium]
MRLPGLRTRVLVLAALLAGVFLGLTGRLAYLQIVRHADLVQMAERQYSRTVVLPARRGPILDRRGAPLATSTPAESLFAQPRSIGDPVRVAARLAPILQLPERDLHTMLTSARPFVWLRRKLPPAVAEQVRALREPGLGFVPEPMRFYPNRELAAHVIGFEGADGGLEGVERALNAELAGAEGRAVVGRDALGRDVVLQRIVQDPVPGAGVMLTLDKTIQYVAEREVEAVYRRTGAKAAMAVAMDPRSGDVLAAAIRPTFNPNSFAELPSRDVVRNRAITDPFEPGSTFKAIMAAAALEERVVRPEDRIYAENGAITIARATIHDWKRYGWLTFAEVLQNSSNVGSIKVGLALGSERYYRYMTAFGFGTPTGVGLSGESRGQLREPRRWSALSLPTMSIGQEVSVTALQLVGAFGAIANGGALMQPRVVRALVDGEGRETRRFEAKAVRQVISRDTSRTLTRILTNVVSAGTGRHAAIAGYDVAGKTGTAQKLDPATRRYSRAPGVLSFIGFAPADDPRFVMLVMLDEPRNEKWGSEAAAPVFAAIGREILRYLEVPARGTQPVQIVTASAGDAAGARLKTAEAVPVVPLDAGGAMPNLRGRSLRHALALLAPLRMEVAISGHGFVAAQAPEPGVSVEPGMAASLSLGTRAGKRAGE